MAIDVSRPNTPGWWLVRLVKRLQAERPEVERLHRYFVGDHPLPEGADGYREAYQAFQRLSRSNYLSLVVEAPLERMNIVGFRSSDDEAGDKATWDIWQQAHLNAQQVHVHRTMLSLRRSFVIVGPHPRKPGRVLITPEHPSQVTVETYADDPMTAQAALKLFQDDVNGSMRATLYLPNYIVKFESERNSGGMADGEFFTENGLRKWNIVSAQINPWGVVPVVQFANRVDLLGRARCEFEDVLDIQNRINTTLLHRLVAEKFGAFRQKAVLNLEFEEDENGDPIAPELPANPAMAWLLQGENLRLEEFSQTDTANILRAVEADIRDLAAITRTPPHYLLGGIVNASGDALASAETGLTAKVRERNGQAGEQWEQVMSIAHLIKGDKARAESSDLEAIWADPEYRTMAEKYDAATKAVTAGVPFTQRMRMLGYSPQEIRRMKTEQAQEALTAALAAPLTPSVGATADAPAPSGQEATE